MYVVRITGMVAGFEHGELVGVYGGDAPEDDTVIRSEADFDLSALALERRRWLKGGRTDDQFREALRRSDSWASTYADVKFPAPRRWLHRSEAEALVELGVAEAVEMGSIEDALAAWATT
jgi:hypothetical protein